VVRGARCAFGFWFLGYPLPADRRSSSRAPCCSAVFLGVDRSGLSRQLSKKMSPHVPRGEGGGGRGASCVLCAVYQMTKSPSCLLLFLFESVAGDADPPDVADGVLADKEGRLWSQMATLAAQMRPPLACAVVTCGKWR
jgi:hypothetical protein